MSFEDYLPTVQPIVESVSTIYGRKGFRYGADSADFAQELYIWVIEHEDKLNEWLDPESYDEKSAVKLIARAMDNECRDYLRDIKAQSLGFERRDEFFYARGEVKSLLPAMFDPEKWLDPPQSEGRSVKAPAEGGNWIATLADLSRAFDQLSVEDQVMLRAFHEAGYSNKAMADVHGVTDSTMSYRHDQAVKRLVNVLGGEVPRPARAGNSADPWRGRHAIQRPQAMAIQSSYYEES